MWYFVQYACQIGRKYYDSLRYYSNVRCLDSSYIRTNVSPDNYLWDFENDNVNRNLFDPLISSYDPETIPEPGADNKTLSPFEFCTGILDSSVTLDLFQTNILMCFCQHLHDYLRSQQIIDRVNFDQSEDLHIFAIHDNGKKTPREEIVNALKNTWAIFDKDILDPTSILWNNNTIDANNILRDVTNLDKTLQTSMKYCQCRSFYSYNMFLFRKNPLSQGYITIGISNYYSPAESPEGSSSSTSTRKKEVRVHDYQKGKKHKDVSKLYSDSALRAAVYHGYHLKQNKVSDLHTENYLLTLHKENEGNDPNYSVFYECLLHVFDLYHKYDPWSWFATKANQTIGTNFERILKFAIIGILYGGALFKRLEYERQQQER